MGSGPVLHSVGPVLVPMVGMSGLAGPPGEREQTIPSRLVETRHWTVCGQRPWLGRQRKDRTLLQGKAQLPPPAVDPRVAP